MKKAKLRATRVEYQMTQEDLAHAVGLTRQTIGLIESGEYNPTLNVCTSICLVLGKTLNDLFWDESELSLISTLPVRWYALEVEAGRQHDVKARIESTIKQRSFQHHIVEVTIPGIVNPAAFADCVMVKMVMYMEAWRIISGTEGVKKSPKVLRKSKYMRVK